MGASHPWEHTSPGQTRLGCEGWQKLRFTGTCVVNPGEVRFPFCSSGRPLEVQQLGENQDGLVVEVMRERI